MRRKNAKLPQSLSERNRNSHRLSTYEEQRYTITGAKAKDYDDDKQMEEYNNDSSVNSEKEQDKGEKDEIQLGCLAGNPEKVFDAMVQCIKIDDSQTFKNILYSISRPQLNQVNDKVIEDKSGRTPLWYAAYYGSIRCLKVIEQHHLSMAGIKVEARNSGQRNVLSIANRGGAVDNTSALKHKDSSNDATRNSKLLRNSKWGTPPLLIGKLISFLNEISKIVFLTN